MGKLIYSINHNYFKQKSLQSCYWAGFIAADGNISKNLLTIALSEKDEIQLVKFNEHTNSNNLIKNNNKDNFIIKRLVVTSKNICKDLKELYNITSNKSLTLIPPDNLNDEQKDAFICGYIDGDGCVCSHLNRNSKNLVISILGTKEILSFIKNRFSEILKLDIKSNIKKKKDTNIFDLRISNNNARIIFLHFYGLSIYKMNRKWSDKIYLEVNNYKRKKTIDFENKLKDYYDLFFIKNLTIKEVMKLKNINYKNCHSILCKVRKMDKVDSVDIEETQSV